MFFNKKAAFVIAEVGINHDGSISKAKKLISAASKSGADAVKFQIYKTEKIMSANYKIKHDKNYSPKKQFNLLKKNELTFSQFRILKKFCDKIKIEFLATPFDNESADFLAEINVRIIKVSSGDFNNFLFIDHLINKTNPTDFLTPPLSPEQPEEPLTSRVSRAKSNTTLKNKKPKVTQNLTGTKPKITGDTLEKSKRNLFPKAGSANTPAVKKVKSGIAKRLATQTKTAQKKIIKTAAKKAATRGIGKTALKFGAKRVPGLGAIISGAEAVGKLATGDVVGAGLAAGEGILSSIPGVGTVASTALGGYSAVRDARRAAKAASTVRKVLKSTKGAKGAVAVKKAFKASPKITKKLSPTSKKGFKGFMSKVKDPKTAIGKTARIGGGVALDVATPGGVTKKLLGIGSAARPKVDGSHVGRRTAG